MEKFGKLDSEKTIAIVGDTWWPQTAKQEGDKISKTFLCNIWKQKDGVTDFWLTHATCLG